MKIVRFNVGDILELRKNHPCGQKRFRVLRTGSEVRLCCLGCGRDLVIQREKVDKMIIRVISGESEMSDRSQQ